MKLLAMNFKIAKTGYKVKGSSNIKGLLYIISFNDQGDVTHNYRNKDNKALKSLNGFSVFIALIFRT